MREEGELTERANEIVAAVTETAEAASLETIEIEIGFGVPSKEIRHYIEENAVDLAVLGTHGETDFSRCVIGGVSAKIGRTSPVSVMWIREPEANG